MLPRAERDMIADAVTPAEMHCLVGSRDINERLDPLLISMYRHPEVIAIWRRLLGNRQMYPGDFAALWMLSGGWSSQSAEENEMDKHIDKVVWALRQSPPLDPSVAQDFVNRYPDDKRIQYTWACRNNTLWSPPHELVGSLTRWEIILDDCLEYPHTLGDPVDFTLPARVT